MLALIIALAGCSQNLTPSTSSPSTPPAPTGATPVPQASEPSRPDNLPSSSLKSLPVGSSQSSNAGNVTIDIRLNEVKSDSIFFKVEMNTHSVDLDKYDLSSLASLTDEQGNKFTPLSWQGPSGGHHRSGDLIFPLPPSISKGQASHIEIAIKDVAGIPQRLFRWEAK